MYGCESIHTIHFLPLQCFVVYLYKGHMNVPIEGMFPYLVYLCCTIKKLLLNKRFVKFVWRNCTNYTVGGRGEEGWENERTVGVKLVRLVTISNYRRKGRTLYLSLFYVRQVHELSNWGKVSSDNFCRLSFTVSLNSSHLSVEILTWFPVSLWRVSLKGRRDALEKDFRESKTITHRHHQFI